MTEKISREEAEAAGRAAYRDGQPCLAPDYGWGDRKASCGSLSLGGWGRCVVCAGRCRGSGDVTKFRYQPDAISPIVPQPEAMP